MKIEAGTPLCATDAGSRNGYNRALFFQEGITHEKINLLKLIYLFIYF